MCSFAFNSYIFRVAYLLAVFDEAFTGDVSVKAKEDS